VHSGAPGAELKLNGLPWYAGEGDGVIIPKGNHKLEISLARSKHKINSIVSISGELISANFKTEGIEFTYSEDIVPCYVTLDKQPVSVFIDGKKTDCPVYPNSISGFTIKLPAGVHKARIL